MSANIKNRDTLKSYFQPNAIPSAEHFGAVMDSSLNRAEDGIDRLPGEPLRVSAQGEEHKQVLALYPDESAPRPSFVLDLAPGGKAGLGIVDGAPDGAARLFIDQASGRVGVGTTAPSQVLDVVGTARIRGDALVGSRVIIHRNHENGGELLLKARDGTVTHHLRARDGLIRAGWGDIPGVISAYNTNSKPGVVLAGSSGSLHCRDATGKTTIHARGDNGSLNVGSGGKDGTFYLRDAAGVHTIGAAAKDAYLRVGIGSADGTVSVRRASPNQKGGGELTITLTGKTGSVYYQGQLSKLDVAEQGHARIRAHDLWLGHSKRLGKLGRALVDAGGALTLNYAADWAKVSIGSDVEMLSNAVVGGGMTVKGNLSVNGEVVGYATDAQLEAGLNTTKTWVKNTLKAYATDSDLNTTKSWVNNTLKAYATDSDLNTTKTWVSNTLKGYATDGELSAGLKSNQKWTTNALKSYVVKSAIDGKIFTNVKIVQISSGPATKTWYEGYIDFGEVCHDVCAFCVVVRNNPGNVSFRAVVVGYGEARSTDHKDYKRHFIVGKKARYVRFGVRNAHVPTNFIILGVAIGKSSKLV